MNEDMDNLFFKCDSFGRFWSMVSNWLGFETLSLNYLFDHLVNLGGLECFSKYIHLILSIIWISTVWTI